jgi:hypothetical protein
VLDVTVTMLVLLTGRGSRGVIIKEAEAEAASVGEIVQEMVLVLSGEFAPLNVREEASMVVETSIVIAICQY